MEVSRERVIINDIAKEIVRRRDSETKPSKTIINFRNDRNEGKERTVYKVPIELLRFRKDNGRIAWQVLSYEKEHAPLEEATDEAQTMLREFLNKQDPEKKTQLKKMLEGEGQREPAIITADGFLINGNRRKLIIDELYKETGDPEFSQMSVVILPNKGEEGGAPTVIEIEQIENRHQMQSDGKAEYSNFNMALAYRNKNLKGMSIAQQVRDNPQFRRSNEKEVNKEIKRIQNEFLGPLDVADDYLKYFNTDGQYQLVEGRWVAFVDYYQKIASNLENNKWLIQNSIDENEIGKIKDAAYKMIRQQSFPSLQEIRYLVRMIPNWLTNDNAKNEFFKINAIPKDNLNKIDQSINVTDQDKTWRSENQTNIINYVKNAKQSYDLKSEKDTPLILLEQALKKLNHDDFVLNMINIKDLGPAREYAVKIRERADEIENEIYHYSKKLNTFINKKKM